METQGQTRTGIDSYSVTRIGTIRRGEKAIELAIDKPYRAALNGLDGFSHAQVLWWFDRCGRTRLA